MNNVSLMGRLTSDPELKTTPSGVSVTSFSLAVDRGFKDKDGERQADFINIVAWKQTAEFICNYFQKGAMLALTGRIQIRGYEDKDGNKRTAFEVIAEHCYFTGNKAADNASEKAKPKPKAEPEFEEVELEEDDLPF